jgi:hypothetical protein
MDKRTQGPRHLPPCLPNDCTGNNIEWEEPKQAEGDHATLLQAGVIARKPEQPGAKMRRVTSMSHRFVEKKEFRNISRTK